MLKIKHFYFESIDSTQTKAKENLKTLKLDQLTIFSAEHQTHGKGRFNKQWLSPKSSNLYVTMCFALKEKANNPGCITLILALSIAEVLQKVGINAKIKWPNDIFVDGKKIGGILAEVKQEAEQSWMLLGFGLNINMDLESLNKVDKPATSIFALTNRKWGLDPIKSGIENAFNLSLKNYFEKGFEIFKNDFDEISFLKGKKIRFDLGSSVITGTYENIDLDGQLMIKLDNGKTQTVNSGEIIDWE